MPQRLPDGKYVTAKYWGITWAQLSEFFDECRRDEEWDADDNVRNFVTKFVQPRTSHQIRSTMGYALMVNKDHPQEVTIMISHAWDENADRFFADVLECVDKDEVAYICFLSNYQGTANEIDAQLGNDMKRSPFTQVIYNPACQRMLIVPNEELKGDGGGLYSRLWCDWEIKCAADAGIPIHIIPKRDTIQHLLGKYGNSSRDAKCGTQKDEDNIKKAIESMPPQTREFHALAFCFSMYGFIIACLIWNNQAVWLGGFLGGFLLCIAAMWCLKDWFRRITSEEDGFAVLDSVIQGAMNKEYSCASFHPEKDLPVLAFTGVACGFLDCAVRLIMPHGDSGTTDLSQLSQDLKQLSQLPAKGAPDLNELSRKVFDPGHSQCAHWLEGGGFGVLLWMMFNLNAIGPWTGVFVRRTCKRRLYSSSLLSLGIVGMLIGKYFSRNTKDYTGRGLLLALLTGFTCMSAAHRRWKHAVSLLLCAACMVLTYLFSPDTWRETFLVVMGVNGAVLVPNVPPTRRFGMLVFGLLAVFGLFGLGRVDLWT